MLEYHKLHETLAAKISQAARMELSCAAQTVADIMYFAPKLDDTANGATLLEFFSCDNSPEAVAIVRDGYPLGVVTKLGFIKAWGERDVQGDPGMLPWPAWRVPQPLLCDAMEPLEALAQRTALPADAPGHEVFIVTCNGRYAGLGSGAALRRIQHLCAAAARQRRLMQEELQLPAQQHAEFMARAHLRRYLPDHGLLYRPQDGLAGDGVLVQPFANGVLMAVLTCRTQGLPCPAAQAAVLSWLDTQLQAMPADVVQVDPAALIARMQRFLRSDHRAAAAAGAGMHPAAGWGPATATTVRAALVWRPHRGGKLLFAGAGMGISLMRAHSRDLQHHAGAAFTIGQPGCPVETGLQTLEITLDGDFRAVIVTAGLLDQVGGPFGEPMRQGVLNQFIKRHAMLSAREMTHALASHVDDWRGGREQGGDITALVFAARG